MKKLIISFSIVCSSSIFASDCTLYAKGKNQKGLAILNSKFDVVETENFRFAINHNTYAWENAFGGITARTDLEVIDQTNQTVFDQVQATAISFRKTPKQVGLKALIKALKKIKSCK